MLVRISDLVNDRLRGICIRSFVEDKLCIDARLAMFTLLYKRELANTLDCLYSSLSDYQRFLLMYACREDVR